MASSPFYNPNSGSPVEETKDWLCCPSQQVRIPQKEAIFVLPAILMQYPQDIRRRRRREGKTLVLFPALTVFGNLGGNCYYLLPSPSPLPPILLVLYSTFRQVKLKGGMCYVRTTYGHFISFLPWLSAPSGGITVCKATTQPHLLLPLPFLYKMAWRTQRPNFLLYPIFCLQMKRPNCFFFLQVTVTESGDKKGKGRREEDASLAVISKWDSSWLYIITRTKMY